MKKRGETTKTNGGAAYRADARQKAADDTRAVVEKWYRALGFPTRFDPEFYAALAAVEVDTTVTVENYEEDEPDGRKNLLSFLYFCEDLAHRYETKGLPRAVLLDTLSDLVRWLTVWSEVKGRLYLGELGWLKNHFRMKLFKIGRLQYCMEYAKKAVPSLGIRRGDGVLDLHIPAVGRLTPAAVDASLAEAKNFFATYYPDFSYRYFTCHSWLLDDSLREILPEGSNILHFGTRFTVTERHPSREILSYVFRWQIREEELSAALPASPFASRVKERVLAGGTFYEAKGYFPR